MGSASCESRVSRQPSLPISFRGLLCKAIDMTPCASCRWSLRVLEEFFNQGDREKEEGLPVTPLCDRLTTSLPASQINFLEFIVAPLFLQVTTYLIFLWLWLPASGGLDDLLMHWQRIRRLSNHVDDKA